jgi:uncharacterized protein (TIGR02117 family)
MKKASTYFIKSILYFLGFIILYVISVFVFTYIPCNTDFEASSNRNTEILIVSNGVHTDILLPTDTTQFLDSCLLTYQNNNKNTPQYIAYGWGDKGFYLDTPTWADLKFSTAFKATTGLSKTAMHITLYYSKPKVDTQNVFKIMINAHQLEKLREYVATDFDVENKKLKYINCCWYYNDKRDAFYDAKGTYSLFKTCNVWTNNALKGAGIKTAIWAPFSNCVTHHLK